MVFLFLKGATSPFVCIRGALPYEELIVMNYEPFVIFKLLSGFCEPVWFMCCLDPRCRCPYSSLAASHAPLPPSAPPGVGVRVPQMPHITPRLRPPVQSKASQHAARWPPVDAGRLNVTHIIVHHGGEPGKEGGDGELVWERGGPGPDSLFFLCPGQLKSLQPPLWTYSTSPHQALDPPSVVMDKIK